jgi:hypothetical protein
VAGKARYLKDDQSNGMPIVTPEDFKKMQLDQKIKSAWKNITINPQLIRDNGDSFENDLDGTKH